MHWTSYAIATLFALGVVVSFVLAILCLTNKGVKVFIKEEEKEKYKEKEYLRSFACLWVFVAILFVVFAIGVFMGWETDHVLSPFFFYTIISWGYGYIRKSKRFRKDPDLTDVQRELTDKELNMLGYGAVAYYFLLPFFLLLFIFLR
jgi:amino acid transporter